MIVLENETLRVQFDAETGALVGLGTADGAWSILERPELGLSFQLLVPLVGRRSNTVDGLMQSRPHTMVSDDGHTVTFEWDAVRSPSGGRHPIAVRATVRLRDRRLVFAMEVDNRSDLVVENVHYPMLGELRPPLAHGRLTAFGHTPGGASRTDLWPRFPNAYGFCSVKRPTFANVRNNLLGAVGAPVTPFLLLQSTDRGLYWGVDEPSAELVAWHGQLHPGWGDSLDQRVPDEPEVSGQTVHLSFGAVHVPFVAPGERRALTPVSLEGYEGDWHAGTDIYRYRRREWNNPPQDQSTSWAREPHAWQQIQLNSSEDSLRLRFSELPEVARECADRGIAVLQVVGWNEGGQDRNNPSHQPDPRLGSVEELRAAIAACQAMGVKVVMFTKFVWADRASQAFRRHLAPMSIKDPYGDYYVFPGFRYDTMTQLLDINTRRLVPMCFHSERWLNVCATEFATVRGLGADGMLHDEALHHSPALLCFDPDHGHRVGAPVYAKDAEFLSRLRSVAVPDEGDSSDDDYLYAAEACYDALFDVYELSYQRSNDSSHVPLSRYLRPHAPILTAVTGFDDRNMVNQCLLYRYLMSYEPFLFKGRLTDFDQTVDYGRRMDELRTELREWFWDGTFMDTVGATVTTTNGGSHHPYAVFASSVAGSFGVAIANYDPGSSAALHVRIPGNQGPHRYRLVDDERWQPADGGVSIPPRSAAVVVSAGAAVPW